MALADQELALPGADLIAPEIKYTPKTQFKPGELIRIEATVTDNVGVAEVNLFYRSTGDPEYRRVKMAHKDNTDLYWAVLPTNAGPQVQYYLQASDQAGNILLRGRSFDPLTLTIPATEVAGTQVLEPAKKPKPAPAKKTGISKWVWIAAGVVVAGVAGAVALSGGGGGDSTNTGPAGATTVTVHGPTP